MWKRGWKYGIIIPLILILVLSGCDSIRSLFQGSPEEENLPSQNQPGHFIAGRSSSRYYESANAETIGNARCGGVLVEGGYIAKHCRNLYSPPNLEDEEPIPPVDDPDSRCDLIEPEQSSLTLLDIPNGTTDLTLHITIPGGVPGLSLEDSKEDEEWQYTATLGTTKAKHCGLQGFPDRLYCSFTLPSSVLGTTQPLEIKANLCPRSVFSHQNVSILPSGIIKPEKSDEEVTCSSDLGKSDCEASGGTYIKLNNYICVCP